LKNSHLKFAARRLLKWDLAIDPADGKIPIEVVAFPVIIFLRFVHYCVINGDGVLPILSRYDSLSQT
jgi:hypothetical protein